MSRNDGPEEALWPALDAYSAEDTHPMPAEMLDRLDPGAPEPAGRATPDPAELADRPASGSAPPSDPAPPMQTVIKQFSREFEARVRPALGPIRQAADTLAGTSLTAGVRSILPALRDLLHQVQRLIDKVAQQQAYVLIFGPLKSGKSTFMNALCSKYVSEVTSLPAYPCTVHVSHGSTPQCIVTRYDGSSQTYTDQDALYDMVRQAHGQLTRRIREVEAAGEEFDPATHLSEAIRKIDVKLPTPVLAESGAVLVDTPGLYSRMKFGYDQMTREFRHAAACAIFVVKTDNLFLEQVFAEFNELLELFSRVFLIVNLDVTKKDLSADGRLVPSLEHENPQLILDAFRDLSMSGPLRTAADAGRLKIWPIDLLGSASRRIRAEAPAADGDGSAIYQDDRPFEALMGDLTEYLNSTEYLKEFLSDSLRQAATLLAELSELVEDDTLRQLAEQMTDLHEQLSQAQAQAQAAERLAACDFAHQAQSLQDSLLAGAGRQAREIYDRTADALAEAIDSWFDDDSSLQTLKETRIEPRLNAARDELVAFLRTEMSRQVAAASGGLSLAPEQSQDLQTSEFDLAAQARSVLDELVFAQDPPTLKSNLMADSIPVRKSLWDWLCLRSRAAVRQRLLGAPAHPVNPLSADLKARRLGPPARQAMKILARQQLEIVLESSSRHAPEEVVHQYAGRLARRLNEQLGQRRQEVGARLAELSSTLAEAQRVLGDMNAMDDEVRRALEAVRQLRRKFVDAPAPLPSDQRQEPQALEQASHQDAAPAVQQEPELAAQLELEPAVRLEPELEPEPDRQLEPELAIDQAREQVPADDGGALPTEDVPALAAADIRLPEEMALQGLETAEIALVEDAPREELAPGVNLVSDSPLEGPALDLAWADDAPPHAEQEAQTVEPTPSADSLPEKESSVHENAPPEHPEERFELVLSASLEEPAPPASPAAPADKDETRDFPFTLLPGQTQDDSGGPKPDAEDDSEQIPPNELAPRLRDALDPMSTNDLDPIARSDLDPGDPNDNEATDPIGRYLREPSGQRQDERAEAMPFDFAELDEDKDPPHNLP